jgi:hypothetical protein
MTTKKKVTKKQAYVGAPQGNQNAKGGKGFGAGRQALLLQPHAAGFTAGRAGMPLEALKRQRKFATASSAFGSGAYGALQGAMVGSQLGFKPGKAALMVGIPSAILGAGLGYGLNRYGQHLGKKSKAKWSKGK